MARKNDKAKDKKKEQQSGFSVRAEQVQKYLPYLLIAAAIFSVIYWILFYATDLFVVEGVDMFEAFRAAFLIAGIWVIILMLLTGIYMLLNKEETLIYGLLTGGSLLMWVLVNIFFNTVYGIYVRYQLAVGLEIFFNIITLILGIVITSYFWKQRSYYLGEKLAGPKPPVKKKKK